MMPIVDQPAWLRNARTMPLIVSGSQWLRTLIPEEAATTANTAAAQTNKLIKSQKVIEGLISPEPKSGKTGTLKGYGKRIRSEMERLINSSSQQ